MITIRWAAFWLAMLTVAALTWAPIGWGTLILAGLLAIFFIAVCWTFGAFQRAAWSDADPETPAGGAPPNRDAPNVAAPPAGTTHR